MFAFRQEEDLTDIFTTRVNGNKMAQVRSGDTQFPRRGRRCIECQRERRNREADILRGWRFSRRCSGVVLESRDAEPGVRSTRGDRCRLRRPLHGNTLRANWPSSRSPSVDRAIGSRQLRRSSSYRAIYIAPVFSSRRQRCKTWTMPAYSCYRARSQAGGGEGRGEGGYDLSYFGSRCSCIVVQQISLICRIEIRIRQLHSFVGIWFFAWVNYRYSCD